jgi:hypothetical protein
MKNRTRIAALSLCIGLAALTFVLTRTEAVAQGAPTADQLKKLAAEGYETDPEVLKAIATGGTPFSDALMAEAKKNARTVISMKDDWKKYSLSSRNRLPIRHENDSTRLER